MGDTKKDRHCEGVPSVRPKQSQKPRLLRCLRLLAMTFIMVSIFIIAAAARSFGRDNDQNGQVHVVKGSISQIDWVGSNISVRWLQSNGHSGFDELAFSVPQDVGIAKGSGAIGLAELHVGDQVMVEYTGGSLSGLQARSITILQ